MELKDMKADFHHPLALQQDYREKLDRIVRNIQKGQRILQAVQREGITRNQYYQWRKYQQEELDAGLTDTPVINFFREIDEADGHLETDMAQIVIDDAKKGNMKSVYFMLNNRFHWDKKKHEVELSTQEDKTIEFKITEMVDKEEINGTRSGDDINTEEMD